MRVRILLFGVLKDAAGSRQRDVELPDGATVTDVLRWVGGWVTDAGLLNSLAVAVNQEYAGLGTPLRDGDEVALLPPVSGGMGWSGRLCGLPGTHV